MKPSIKDLSKDTGLSLATVSKYLRNVKIREENRLKIEQSIEKLGFVPNRNAQILRSNHSLTIGVVISDISNAFWGSIVDYIEEFLRKNGYMTAIYSLRQIHQGAQIFSSIISQNLDGIIIALDDQNDTAYEAFLARKIPVVLIDQKPNNVHLDFVTSDNFQGGYVAGKHLIDRGHTKLGIISGWRRKYTTKERFRGFLAALEEAGIQPVERYFREGEFSVDSGQLQFKSLMDQVDPPEAIFATGVDVGIGALLEANSEGFCIGSDISLISFDDDEIFSGSTPPVTVVRQNVEKIGQQAASLVLMHISENNNEPMDKIYLIPTEFVERNSVKDNSIKRSF
jgi:DNA-binding LacI/PurR family transcriptional regulator